MQNVLTIEIKNQLKKSRKSIEVVHSYTGIVDTLSVNNSITLPLPTGDKEKADFVQIGMTGGTRHMKGTICIDLPAWASFTFVSEQRVAISPDTSGGNRQLLEIPAGLSGWKLNISKPAGVFISSPDSITIGEGGIIS